MKIFNAKSTKISRTILIAIAILSIPFLLFAEMWERAGGGIQKTKYLLFPFISILTFSAFILYKRKVDKTKGVRSNIFIIVSEIIIGFIALAIGILSMYAMLSWSFETQFFLILAGLVLISTIILADNYNDIKSRMKN